MGIEKYRWNCLAANGPGPTLVSSDQNSEVTNVGKDALEYAQEDVGYDHDTTSFSEHIKELQESGQIVLDSSLYCG